MNGKTLIQSIVFGFLVVLPMGASLGMPFSHAPPNGQEWQKEGSSPILLETAPDRHLGTPPETLFLPSFDEVFFNGNGDRNPGRVNWDPLLMLPSVEGDGQLAGRRLIKGSSKRGSPGNEAGPSLQPVAAWSAVLAEAALEDPRSTTSSQDEIELSPLPLLITGLLLLALSGVVWRQARRPLVQKEEPNRASLLTLSDS